MPLPPPIRAELTLSRYPKTTNFWVLVTYQVPFQASLELYKYLHFCARPQPTILLLTSPHICRCRFMTWRIMMLFMWFLLRMSFSCRSWTIYNSQGSSPSQLPSLGPLCIVTQPWKTLPIQSRAGAPQQNYCQGGKLLGYRHVCTL